MIAITFALAQESADLRRRKIDKEKVTIVHTGVGRKSCQHKIDNFLSANRPRLVMSSGYAGGLNRELRTGDLIFAENFSDGDLISRARQILGGRAQSVQLFTSTSIVDAVEERDRIARENAADAVDMETEVIKEACVARGIPMLSLRVISDTPNAPLPAPPHVLFDIERQRTNGARLASYLLTNPGRIGDLIRFGKRIAHVRAKLTDAIVELVPQL